MNLQILPEQERLPAAAWAGLLGISERGFRLRAPEPVIEERGSGGMQTFRFGDLPEDWRAQLAARLEEDRGRDFSSLVSSQSVGWKPRMEFAAFPQATREKAKKMFDVMEAYFATLEATGRRASAEERAQAMFKSLFSFIDKDTLELVERTISAHRVRGKAKAIERLGGWELLKAQRIALTFLCDNKNVPHKNRLEIPAAFVKAFRAKCLEPGVVSVSAAFIYFELLWQHGEEVPGLGRARREDEPFPFKLAQLRSAKVIPTRAARLMATLGKGHAMLNGALPSLPCSRAKLGLRQRIEFDDKRPDLNVIGDDGRIFQPWIYFARDVATGQIIDFALRPDGNMKQRDVVDLTVAVIRFSGFAPGAMLKFEHGTVSISEDRAEYLRKQFGLQISRTELLGGRGATGLWREKTRGNPRGKPYIESFNNVFTHLIGFLKGQRGNDARVAMPDMHGDPNLTPATLTHKNYRLKNSITEEALLCAQNAVMCQYFETGEILDARAACAQSGIEAPLVHLADFLEWLKLAIAYYNRRRGHRMDGFAKIEVNGRLVTESPDDKEKRLLAEMGARGESLLRISEKDAALLMMRIARATFTANGCVINGCRFWHEHSRVVHEAQRVGKKEFLIIHDVDRPFEIHVLKNPVSHIDECNEKLADDAEKPEHLETIPMFVPPERTDPEAMIRRNERQAINHNRIAREALIGSQVYIEAETARREGNTAALDALRARVCGLTAQVARELPESELAGRINSAESRAAQRDAAKPKYIESLGDERDWAATQEDET